MTTCPLCSALIPASLSQAYTDMVVRNRQPLVVCEGCGRVACRFVNVQLGFVVEELPAINPVSGPIYGSTIGPRHGDLEVYVRLTDWTYIRLAYDSPAWVGLAAVPDELWPASGWAPVTADWCEEYYHDEAATVLRSGVLADLSERPKDAPAHEWQMLQLRNP